MTEQPTVTLEWEQVDEMAVVSIKSSIQLILEDPWSLYHDYQRSLDTVNALLEALKYYMSDGDYLTFFSEEVSEGYFDVIYKIRGDRW